MEALLLRRRGVQGFRGGPARVICVMMTLLVWRHRDAKGQSHLRGRQLGPGHEGASGVNRACTPYAHHIHTVELVNN